MPAYPHVFGSHEPNDGCAMKCLRYQEDRLPVTLIASLFICDLVVYFLASALPILIAWLLFGLCLKIFIACWNHHHQHVPTFHQTILNRLLEIVYTFHTGITTNVWVLHHNLGHHVHYLDQKTDESRWKHADGRTMGVVEYTLITGLTGYLRAIRVGRRYPKHRKDFTAMGIANLLLLALLLWHDFQNGMIVFLIPMTLVYFGTCWVTYYHHAGLDTDDPFHASHNITNRYYNIVSGNLGCHTAHHLKQALHWSKLPELHRSIVHKIPPELIDPNFPVLGRIFKFLNTSTL